MKPMSRVLREYMADEYASSDIDQALIAVAEIAPDAEPASRVTLWLSQLFLPDLVEALEQVIVAAEEKPRIQRMAGGLLTYVYNPLGLIPDSAPVGRLDDVLVCALGLRRLRELHGVELSPGILAICDLASRQLRHLSPDLRQGIEELEQSLEGPERVKAES